MFVVNKRFVFGQFKVFVVKVSVTDQFEEEVFVVSQYDFICQMYSFNGVRFVISLLVREESMLFM